MSRFLLRRLGLKDSIEVLRRVHQVDGLPSRRRILALGVGALTAIGLGGVGLPFAAASTRTGRLFGGGLNDLDADATTNEAFNALSIQAEKLGFDRAGAIRQGFYLDEWCFDGHLLLGRLQVARE